jgi:hypothetical protein
MTRPRTAVTRLLPALVVGALAVAACDNQTQQPIVQLSRQQTAAFLTALHRQAPELKGLGDRRAVRYGVGLCNALESGDPAAQEAKVVAGSGLSAADRSALLAAATAQLCPEDAAKASQLPGG